MRRAVFVIVFALSGGCASGSSVALRRAVMAYDRTNADVISELLLLNIARVHRDQPPHFTALSSVAATYDFRFSAGVGPAATGDVGYLPMPTIAGGYGETPTMTITPMQGDEFTNRLLTPFDEAKVALLLSQQYDVDALLRLLGESVRRDDGGAERIWYNRPAAREGYTGFRRVMAHLSSVQDRNALHVGPLQFRLHRVVPAASYGGSDVREHNRDSSFRYDAARQVYEFDTDVVGRVLISNYDPTTLTNDARVRLQDEASLLRENEVLIDVREGHPGGEYPIHAVLRLRSFLNVLAFVARGIAAEREYDVVPDARTPSIRENPAQTLGVLEGRGAPDGAGFSVSLDGRTYALAIDQGYPWNLRAFSILYQLFQMTVAPVRGALPLISIGR